jgi:hypothetical protein
VNQLAVAAHFFLTMHFLNEAGRNAPIEKVSAIADMRSGVT